MRKIKTVTLLVIITLLFVIPISINTLSAATVVDSKIIESNKPFRDIHDSYARDAILNLYTKGILNGTSPELFSPTMPITRAEFISTLVRLLQLEPSTSKVQAYKDVPITAWYYGSIQTATELAWTEGVGGGLFEPNKPITRQETAAWVIRALKQSVSNTSTTRYKDSSAIALWARPYVYTISKLELMTGDNGSFYPTHNITRQETAVILYRLLQNKSWANTLDAKDNNSTIQIGWQYNQSSKEYEQSIQNSNVNVLSPRWFFLDKDETIGDYANSELLNWAKTNKKDIWPLIGNRSSQETTHRFLSSFKSSEAGVQKIKSFVIKYNLHGINLDFENVAPGDRKNFSTFVTNLSEQLHSIGAVVSVNVSPDMGTDWTEAFDYRLLGQKSDYIVLMGYDEYWSGSPLPGPVASLPWVRNGLDTLLKSVPAEKVILALPHYNRDWTVNSKGAAVSSEDISLIEQNIRVLSQNAKPVWNKQLGQYTADYTKNKIPHRFWLEEARSLSGKYQMAKDRHIAGFAYWYVGGETPDIWTSLRNVERYSSYKFD